MEFSMMYDLDLSLFGGDLLVDLPLADSELYESSASDGQQPKPSLWSDVSNGISQDVSLATGPADLSGLHEPYSESWLDSKMDLLEYMCMPVEDDVNCPSAITIDIRPLEEKSPGSTGSLLDPSTQAVQLLKEAAAETAGFLDSKTSDSTDDLANNSSEGMDLLEMLYKSMPEGPLDMLDSDVLAPMSPEDIESLLSSEPASPSSAADDDSILSSYMCSETSASDLSVSDDSTLLSISIPTEVTVDSDLAHLLLSVEENKGDSHTLEIYTQTSTSRAKPYDRKAAKDGKTRSPTLTKEEKIQDKKLRKKQQNKDAAIRYRQKKRAESEAINGELEELETHNQQLKNTVGQMTGEIQYLKNLLAEVYQARGLKLKSSK